MQNNDSAFNKTPTASHTGKDTSSIKINQEFDKNKATKVGLLGTPKSTDSSNSKSLSLSDNSENDHNAFNIESPRDSSFSMEQESSESSDNMDFSKMELTNEKSIDKHEAREDFPQSKAKAGSNAYSHFVNANYSFFPGAGQQQKVKIYIARILLEL